MNKATTSDKKVADESEVEESPKKVDKSFPRLNVVLLGGTSELQILGLL